MYVEELHNTRQLTPDLFTRIATLCRFETWDPEITELTRSDNSGEFLLTWPSKGDIL